MSNRYILKKPAKYGAPLNGYHFYAGGGDVKKEKFRRRNIVNKKYQFSQVAVALTANLLVALLMAVLMSWFYLLVLDGGVVCNHNRQVPLYLAGAALVIVLSDLFWSLRRSRSIAGMMCKLDIVLADAARGVFPGSRLVFRKRDPFARLAGPLNACLVRLKMQQRHEEMAVRALQDLQQEFETGGMDSADAAHALDKVIAQIKTDNRSDGSPV